MQIKRIGGKVYGAGLNAAEKKALQIEVHKTFAEYDIRNANEVDAMILWILYNEFDFTEEQLKKFHDCFYPEIRALVKRYELPGSDTPWLCTKKLLDHGIDISEWNKTAEKSDLEILK